MQRVLFLTTRAGGGRGPAVRCRSLIVAVVLYSAVLPAVLGVSDSALLAADCARASFTVIGPSADRGRVIVEAADRIRQRAFAELLGVPEPAAWVAACEIHVHATPDDFAAAVGGSPAAARGATSLEFAADRVSLRRIDVMGDGAEIVPDALAHEIVHVVLAERFTAAAPPRWADEGLALLFDPHQKQHDHDADFREAHRRGLAWSLEDLLALEEYPAEVARQRVYYGQSAALVRWLIARRDAATFVRFIEDAAAVGTAAALDRHYDFGSVDSLELAWKEVAPIESLGMTLRPSSLAAD